MRRKAVFCDEYGAGVYYVLDCSGAGARREITRKPPPQVRFFTKFRTTTNFVKSKRELINQPAQEQSAGLITMHHRRLDFSQTIETNSP